MNIETGNLFDSIPSDTGQEVFTDLVRGANVKIERIISRGQSSPASGWYDQPENEWVVVLQGEAKLLFENDVELYLQAGSHVNIAAHTKHKVSWTKPDVDTIWLAVHYS